MEDAAIVELFWQRKEQAITETDLKYGKYCRKIAGNICRSYEDAEECINDTWLSAWNQMPDKRPLNLGSFLSTICRNFAINRRRAQARQKRGGDQLELALTELEDCIPEKKSVEAEYELRELIYAINGFCDTLHLDDRRIFIARYWFMASNGEIAERLGFTEGKVRTSLYRSRLRLRKYLEREGLI